MVVADNGGGSEPPIQNGVGLVSLLSILDP